jgi:hypothetical protein
LGEGRGWTAGTPTEWVKAKKPGINHGVFYWRSFAVEGNSFSGFEGGLRWCSFVSANSRRQGIRVWILLSRSTGTGLDGIERNLPNILTRVAKFLQVACGWCMVGSHLFFLQNWKTGGI